MYRGERLNGITHVVGTALAVVGLPVLVVQAVKTGRALPVVTFSIYGTTLVLLYLFSTLYHSLKGRAKAVFRKLDHIAIFLLIAGTYTPVALVSVGGTLGWTLFGVNWGLAVLGIGNEFIRWRGARWLGWTLYAVMGWLAIVALGPVLAAVGAAGAAWLIAGGVLYTVGFAVYAWRSLPHHHGIFHLLVLGGSACHFVAVLLIAA